MAEDTRKTSYAYIEISDSPVKDRVKDQAITSHSSEEAIIIIPDSPAKQKCRSSQVSDVNTAKENTFVDLTVSDSEDKYGAIEESTSEEEGLYNSEEEEKDKKYKLPESDSEEEGLYKSEEEEKDKKCKLPESDSEEDCPTCQGCHKQFSSVSNLNKHQRRFQCHKRNKEDIDFHKLRKKLDPSLWSSCKVKEVDHIPYDVDGLHVFKLKYEESNMMKSSKDGRPWNQWVTSTRMGFHGVRRISNCAGTFICRNSKCPCTHSYGKSNKMQFKKKNGNCVECECCGYKAEPVKCSARKVWEFEYDNVKVYHFGNHTCEAKIVEEDLSQDASAFFKDNINAKPSQYPYERLRAMLKEGKPVADVYKSASSMANLKKIQNIKQKVVAAINPVGHSFEAVAKIKEVSDKQDKYLLWKVQDGRLSENKMTVVFRSSKERIKTAVQMQNGGDHPLAEEYCYLDAEHDKVAGMKTINLSVQHPTLKEMVTIASMDCERECTETLCEFWHLLNKALQDFTKDNKYIFDPCGIITDEHGANRASIERVLNRGLLDRAKSCETHFYDCAHEVAKSDWSPKAKAEFITMIHDIYCCTTPSAYEVKRKMLMDWASKDKRKHVKTWFNKFWHLRRYHVFRAFKTSSAPNTNMAEVGHSRNAVRGAKKDTLARVAEDHIVESALLKAKFDSNEGGTYRGGRCKTQKEKDVISLRRQLDRATQFAKELSSNEVDVNAYSTGPYVNKSSSHRVKKKSVNMKNQSTRPEQFW